MFVSSEYMNAHVNIQKLSQLVHIHQKNKIAPIKSQQKWMIPATDEILI
jgi:hypothetical protein